MPARVAPAVTLNGRPAGALETPLQRRADPDVGQMMVRLSKQTWLRAQDIADAGAPGRLWDDIVRGLGRFWTCYVWRQGLREGELGFLISLMAGLDPILSGFRAREILRARAVDVALEAQPQPTRIGRVG